MSLEKRNLRMNLEFRWKKFSYKIGISLKSDFTLKWIERRGSLYYRARKIVMRKEDIFRFACPQKKI